MAKKLNADTPTARKNKKPRIGFLDLPAEIRNQIYGYYFDESIHIDMSPGRTHIPMPVPPTKPIRPGAPNPPAAVTGPAPTTQQTNRTLNVVPAPKKRQSKPKTRRINVNHPLGRHNVDKDSTKWSSSYGSLVLTCKLINYEITPLFYATPVFIFSSMNRLHKFLLTVPPKSLACIRGVHFAAGSYAEPFLMADRQWKAKHDEQMEMVVKKAAKLLPNLERLSIRHCTSGYAPLGLNESWAQMWSAFKPKEGAKVAFTLESDMLRDCRSWNWQTVDSIWELHRLFNEAMKKILLGCSMEDAAIGWREGVAAVTAVDLTFANNPNIRL
ncbi:hypothetical protein K490DRAFT_49813 [Saccharata proteae CBS 121410]|uniref:DUF7730 domain-containing protein n=1 Tax=Saccharata proteae CBS 121410 TaxID=1314787 RepID=A0A9P4LWM3_9PEZI|nr:hypothetical protein K490DRAFT_49813 [Saccharata proteae CBS 121410]